MQMHTRGKKRLFIHVVLIFLLPAAVGCGGQMTGAGTPQGIEEGRLQGTITVSGAWALYPLMVRWGEEFRELHPRVRLDISAGGAGKGMADVLANAVDIGMVSREVYPEEVAKGAFWVSVSKDAVFAVVNAGNPVREDLYRKGVTRDQLLGIFMTGEITSWGQVVGRPEVTDPIHVYTRSDACGAAHCWAGYLGGAQEDLRGIAVYGDPGLLDAVVRDPLGIGYSNLNFAFDLETGLPVDGAWMVPIDLNGNGQVDPEERYDTKDEAVNAVAVGAYPSPPARDLNLVTRGKPEGLVRVFITWILTNGQEFVDEAGYISLPKDKLNEELNKLD